LWNRNPRYKPEQLDQLIADKHVFEYWSHAAAYMPMCNYRYSLPRKQALACGDLNHFVFVCLSRFIRSNFTINANLARMDSLGSLNFR
jgi:hypothetical protein